MPSSLHPSGYLTLLRHNRNFRLLWLGQIVSLLGDWFNLIASASLVSQLTGSGLAVGGLFVVRMLAPVVFNPLAGVWGDQLNRKWLLIVTDVLRAVIVLGFLLVREPQHAWLLFALTALQLALSGVYYPVRTAILPDVVSPAELGAANALSSGTWSVMLALGAALGGLAAGQWGIYPAFVIDSLSFVVSAGLVVWVDYRRPAAEPGRVSRPDGFLSAYAAGLRYLGRQPDILAISLLKTSMAFGISGGFQVLQVRLSEQVYPIGQGGAVSLGWMYAAVGLGTGLGPILARRFTGDRDRPLRLAIVLAYGAALAGLLFVVPLGGFGWVLFGTLLRGVGAGVNWVFSSQLLFQLVPAEVRGRVFATEFALLSLAAALSAGLGGWALDGGRLEIVGLLWAMIAVTLLGGGLWAAWVFGRRPARQPASAD